MFKPIQIIVFLTLTTMGLGGCQSIKTPVEVNKLGQYQLLTDQNNQFHVQYMQYFFNRSFPAEQVALFQTAHEALKRQANFFDISQTYSNAAGVDLAPYPMGFVGYVDAHNRFHSCARSRLFYSGGYELFSQDGWYGHGDCGLVNTAPVKPFISFTVQFSDKPLSKYSYNATHIIDKLSYKYTPLLVNHLTPSSSDTEPPKQ